MLLHPIPREIPASALETSSAFIMFIAETVNCNLKELPSKHLSVIMQVIEFLLRFDPIKNSNLCRYALDLLAQYCEKDSIVNKLPSVADLENLKDTDIGSMVDRIISVFDNRTHICNYITELIVIEVGFSSLYNIAAVTSWKQFFATPVNMKELGIVVDLVKGCHDHNDCNKMFIAACAPSLSGKTQMSISLDRFSESPLIPSFDQVEKPLKVVVRITISHVRMNQAILDNLDDDMAPQDAEMMADALAEERISQKINWTLFNDRIRKTVNEDYELITNGLSEKNLSKAIGCTKITKTFGTKNASAFLGLIVAWIQARIDGRDSTAFSNCSTLEIFSKPLTITATRQKLANFSPKPFVIVLDEFDYQTQSRFSFKTLVFIRNILRASGFVVIVMGTNSRLSNLSKDGAVGSDASGGTKTPWAHVLTNVFSRPDPDQQHIHHRFLKNLTCFKSGVWNIFESCLTNHEELNTKNVYSALKNTFSDLYVRKQINESINWIIGQVACMGTRFRNRYDLALNVQDNLLNHHYAFIETLSPDKSIHFFGLIRRENDLSLQIVPWTRTERDIDWRPINNHPETQCHMRDFFENARETVAVLNSATANEIPFAPSSHYPKYNADELTHLALFATESPFQTHRKILDDRLVLPFRDYITMGENYQPNDLIDLTTRAACTIYYRKVYETSSPDEENDTQKSPRSGSFLEFTTICAMIIASHSGELSGVKFGDFMLKFVSELAMHKSNLHLDESSHTAISGFDEFRFPHIPVIQASCSDIIKSLPNAETGFIRMCRNAEEIDVIGYSDCLMNLNASYSRNSAIIFTAEAKNHKKKAGFALYTESLNKSMTTVNNLTFLDGRPPRVHFHFFVASRITKATKSTWLNFRQKFPDVSVIVATRIVDGVLEFKNPFPESKPDFASAFRLTCLILIPIEDLYPTQGHFNYTNYT